MSDNLYMKDAAAKTIDGIIAVMEIIRTVNPTTKRPIGAAEHDVIYFDIPSDVDAATSEKLARLGCHYENESWAMFV
jgi:hypothetical protein